MQRDGATLDVIAGITGVPRLCQATVGDGAGALWLVPLDQSVDRGLSSRSTISPLAARIPFANIFAGHEMWAQSF